MYYNPSSYYIMKTYFFIAGNLYTYYIMRTGIQELFSLILRKSQRVFHRRSGNGIVLWGCYLGSFQALTHSFQFLSSIKSIIGMTAFYQFFCILPIHGFTF